MVLAAERGALNSKTSLKSKKQRREILNLDYCRIQQTKYLRTPSLKRPEFEFGTSMNLPVSAQPLLPKVQDVQAVFFQLN